LDTLTGRSSAAAAGAVARRCVALLLCLLLAFAGSNRVASAAGAGPATDTPRGFRILNQQPLRALRVGADGRALEFEAFGRRFALRLERNERLRFVTSARLPGVEALRGTVEGVAGSWVRLTATSAGYYGMIFDGSDYYAIEPARAVAAHAVGPVEASGNEPVIYRLADTVMPAGEASCGTVTRIGEPVGVPSVTGQQVLEQVAGELEALAVTLPNRLLRMTVVGDFELSGLSFGGTTTVEQTIAARMNIVDGIYAAQAAVKVEVAEVIVFRTANDPFSDTLEAGVLLGEVGVWRQSTPGQSARGLTHLITGRDLNTTTVGVAYVGGLCSARFGVGLSQGNLSVTNSALVIAHEMGHNFGASHDGETGSVCESTATTFLMAARLNGSQTFSQCSLDTIAPRVASASCLTPISVPDADIDAPAPARRLRAVAFDYSFNVRSIGAVPIDGVTVAVTLPASLTLNSSQVAGGTSCTRGADGVLSCPVGSLGVQASRAITLNLTGTQAGPAAVTIRLSSPGDAVSANNAAQVSFGIDPSGDLSVALSAAPVSFTTAGSSQVTARVQHLGGDPVSDARLSFTVPAGLAVTAVGTNALGCVLAAGVVSCAATPLVAGASQEVLLTVSSAQPGSRSLAASVGATLGDPVTGNNSGQVSLEVSNPPSSGGGGGSLGFGTLVLLSLALLASSAGPALRRRRARSPPRARAHARVL
jgi:hypothetical protein